METQPHLSVYTTLKVVPWMAGLRNCDRDHLGLKFPSLVPYRKSACPSSRTRLTLIKSLR